MLFTIFLLIIAFLAGFGISYFVFNDKISVGISGSIGPACYNSEVGN